MPKTDHFAVVSGIGLYPGFDNGDLDGPVYDAADFIKWLNRRFLKREWEWEVTEHFEEGSVSGSGADGKEGTK